MSCRYCEKQDPAITLAAQDWAIEIQTRIPLIPTPGDIEYTKYICGVWNRTMDEMRAKGARHRCLDARQASSQGHLDRHR